MYSYPDFDDFNRYSECTRYQRTYNNATKMVDSEFIVVQTCKTKSGIPVLKPQMQDASWVCFEDDSKGMFTFLNKNLSKN
jgi:hypothetical protein